jgi:hypothetical protein
VMGCDYLPSYLCLSETIEEDWQIKMVI